MSKPRILALAIGAAGLAVLAGGLGATGPLRWAAAWIAVACGTISFAYLTNQPAWLGKQDGRLVWWRVLPVAPYVLAYAVAARLRRVRRRYASWNEVAPGVFVGARVSAAELPRGVDRVVDLTAEIPEVADVRRLPGYRGLPVLDGSFPRDPEGVLGLLEELADAAGGVYVHCVSGRGRAPTLAAALLIARGLAPDAASAFELVRKGRSASAPTAGDVRFVERLAARLR